MTNGVQGATVSSTYANTVAKNTGSKEAVAKQGGNKSVKNETKLENLKQQIESGNYKVDIDKLAQKMAEELIS